MSAKAEWMDGGVGKRPGRSTWTAQVSWGMQRVRVCGACRKKRWAGEGPYPAACACGGELGPEHEAKLVTMRSGFRTKAEATTWRNTALGRRAAGGLPFETEPDPEPDADLSTGAYLDRWLADKAGLIRPSTHRRYAKLLERAEVVRDVPLAKLRKADIRAILVKAAKDGLAPATVRQLRAVLSTAFLVAVSDDVIPSNPAAVPLPTKVPDADVPTVPWDAMRRLREAAAGTEWETPMAIAGLGLRRSEVLAVRWADVDLDARTLSVSGTLKVVRNDDELVAGTEVICPTSNRSRRLLATEPTKTDKSRRTIKLTEGVAATLRATRVRQAERRLAAGGAWHDHDFVCDRGDGLPLHPDTFSQVAKRLMAAAGIDSHLHAMRHTTVVRQLEQGVPAVAVAEHHGHADAGFTQKVYGHVTSTMKDAATAALEDETGTG